MAPIPSLTEAYTVIILLAPGFLTFRLFSWRASYEFVFSSLQITLWSIISSAIVFIPFAAILQFQSMTDLETRVLQYDAMILYFVLAGVIGFVSGEVTRRIWRKGITSGSVWANFAFNNVGDWVDVHTTNGAVYRGWIKQMSTLETSKRELELAVPELLQIKNNKRSWVGVGDSIVFTEKDVNRIILLNHSN